MFKFIVVGFLALIGLSALGLVFNIVTKPAQVINKTLETNNIINNYEYFHDAYGNYTAKVAQVKQFKSLYATETDAGEKSRLRIDMAAIQQSCRDLANRYNANAAKSNRSIFMGTTVPSTLNIGACE